MFIHSRSRNVNFARLLENADKIYRRFPYVKRARQRSNFWKAVKLLAVCLVILTVVILAYTVFYIHILNTVYTRLSLGQDTIRGAVDLFRQNEYQAAFLEASRAKDSLQPAAAEAEKLKGFVLSGLVPVNREIGDLEAAIGSLQIIADTLAGGANIAGRIGERFNSGSAQMPGKTDREGLLTFIYENEPEINGLMANLDLAGFSLQKSASSFILAPFTDSLDSVRDDLGKLVAEENAILPPLLMLPILGGYPEQSTFLIAFEDSRDLQPAGGRLNQIGILETEHGRITGLSSYSAGNIDKQAGAARGIVPPESLARTHETSDWPLEDANWSPDWSVAAGKIEKIFIAKTGQLPASHFLNRNWKFNGIIGVTPDFFSRLLAVAGPINIGGREINKENAASLFAGGTGSLPGTAMKTLLKTVLDGQGRETAVLGAVAASLKDKSLQIELDDSDWQTVADRYLGNGGDSSQSDYISVVDADLEPAAPGRSISHNARYRLDQDINGSFGELTMSYAYPGGFESGLPAYRSFTRIYVPLGTALLESDSEDGAVWEVSREADRTVFSGTVTVAPGKISRYAFSYKLPDNLDSLFKLGRYRLLFARQAGKELSPLEIEMKFNRDIASFAPTGFYVKQDGRTVSWETDLSSDREFVVKF